MADKKLKRNIVVVGDGDTGKTSLLFAYTEGAFLTTYEPTIYDRDEIGLKLDNNNYSIYLHDTAGQEDFIRIRQLAYKEADVFILCYSTVIKDSFENISSKWIPELNASFSQVPVVLVGTKMDLRDNCLTSKLITTEEGEKLRRKIKAASFIECSAKNGYNIKEVIYEAIRASEGRALYRDYGNNGCCSWIRECFEQD